MTGPALLDRCRASMAAAKVTCQQSATLVDDTVVTRTASFGTRARIARRRGGPGATGLAMFRVRGEVDGRSVAGED